MHLNSRLAFSRYVLPYISDGQSVLEIGHDDDPSTYRREASRLSLRWETADLGNALMPDASSFQPATRPTYTMIDPYKIPVPDESVDVVIAGQVIEHVPRICAWM